MPDPRSQVRPGQKLQIAAEQINFLNRMMRQGGGFGSSSLSGWMVGTNLILARNDSENVVPGGGVLRLSGVVIDPAANYAAAAQFFEMPCVTGLTPEETTQAVVVAAEPIAQGKIGRVVASGVAQARVKVLSPYHKFARATDSVEYLESCAGGMSVARLLWAPATLGTHWAVVRLGDAPTIVLAKFSGLWVANATLTVQLYSPGEDPPEEYVEAKNLLCTVGSPCGAESWCWIFWQYDSWHLLSAGCVYVQ